jgi:hypothetical protein
VLAVRVEARLDGRASFYRHAIHTLLILRCEAAAEPRRTHLPDAKQVQNAANGGLGIMREVQPRGVVAAGGVAAPVLWGAAGRRSFWRICDQEFCWLIMERR